MLLLWEQVEFCSALHCVAWDGILQYKGFRSVIYSIFCWDSGKPDLWACFASIFNRG
jgi:hypothetical protein